MLLGLPTSTGPVGHISLAGVGLLGLSADITDVGAQVPGLRQVDGHVHAELLQAPALVGRAHHVGIFLENVNTRTFYKC